MSAPTTVSEAVATGPTRREKEILLLALAKDVLTSTGHTSLRIEDESGALIVSLESMPVRLDGTPSECTPEHASELRRRAATLDESELLFEYESD